MNFTTKLVLGCFSLLIFCVKSFSQEVSVKYSKSEIALNEYFTITLTIENDKMKEYSGFPEIEGFVKRGTSNNTSMTFRNGKMSSSQSIVQNYQATREGTFELKPWQIKINDKTLKVSGKKITVGPARQQQRQQRYDPFDPFDMMRDNQPQEYIDVEADAFLALTTDKSEVFVGEGFTATLAFYVAETNQANMRFYDLVNQLTELVKKIKPENTWEENFSIDNITAEKVTLNGKGYSQYKVFQSSYFPLNADDISFPSLELKMVKYKVAKNPSFFGRSRQEDFETFTSRPKTIKVNPLPPHPLRDRVAVGNYRMAESISAIELQTGQSFNYTFNIIGEGNISAIEKPMLPETESFDFYAPNVEQKITRTNGRVRGTKGFNYYAIPNEPGTYELGDYFQWVFFNTSKDRYDTLKSRQEVVVTGESRKNEYIMSNDMGSFYDRVEFENNELVSLDESDWFRMFANILILVMLALAIIVMVKK